MICLSTKGAVVLPAGTFEAETEQATVLWNVSCSGDEGSIEECNLTTTPGVCSEPGAAVVCQGKN